MPTRIRCNRGCGIVPVLEDGKLKSSGDTILAADDKSGIAIMLELLEVLKGNRNPPSGHVLSLHHL